MSDQTSGPGAELARVLFVDDEPNVLAGLRRRLSGQRSVWEMTFASGGEEALALMAQQPVDVVVTDMRMPGMDGAQLLGEVLRLYPATARIVLSGHAGLESIIAAIGPTQQYLAKPCETDTLVAAVEGVLRIRDMLSCDQIRKALGGVENLPKPPRVHTEMVAVVSTPDFTIADVAAVVERDIATVAEVLKLVNSAFFVIPQPVESITRAVALLGMETVRSLALSGAVFRPGPQLPESLDVEELRQRGLHAGVLAQRIAVAEGWQHGAPGHAFLAGLLHELGLLVLASGNPGGYEAIRRAALADPGELQQLERREFGCTVGQAGGYLLGLWGFPVALVQAVASQPCQPTGPAAVPLDHAVAFAVRYARAPELATAVVPVGYLDAERVARWAALCAGHREAG
ncbi:MAG: HDOD domain-containing protein [Actinobacteria bacterium]|nr:HDOD domain-containing protein [Actinomycetota bacterium]MBI3688863.1 HDOD domain-containing protein [Actinomycetota bacterium]